MKPSSFIMAVLMALPFIAIVLLLNFLPAPSTEHSSQQHSPAKITIGDGAELPDAVPETLAGAIAAAEMRRDAIAAMDDATWAEERLKVMYRNPPKNPSDAVARAQHRIDKLLSMDDATWEQERKRLLAMHSHVTEAITHRDSEDLRSLAQRLFEKYGGL